MLVLVQRPSLRRVVFTALQGAGVAASALGAAKCQGTTEHALQQQQPQQPQQPVKDLSEGEGPPTRVQRQPEVEHTLAGEEADDNTAGSLFNGTPVEFEAAVTEACGGSRECCVVVCCHVLIALARQARGGWSSGFCRSLLRLHDSHTCGIIQGQLSTGVGGEGGAGDIRLGAEQEGRERQGGSGGGIVVGGIYYYAWLVGCGRLTTERLLVWLVGRWQGLPLPHRHVAFVALGTFKEREVLRQQLRPQPPGGEARFHRTTLHHHAAPPRSASLHATPPHHASPPRSAPLHATAPRCATPLCSAPRPPPYATMHRAASRSEAMPALRGCCWCAAVTPIRAKPCANAVVVRPDEGLIHGYREVQPAPLRPPPQARQSCFFVSKPVKAACVVGAVVNSTASAVGAAAPPGGPPPIAHLAKLLPPPASTHHSQPQPLSAAKLPCPAPQQPRLADAADSSSDDSPASREASGSHPQQLLPPPQSPPPLGGAGSEDCSIGSEGFRRRAERLQVLVSSSTTRAPAQCAIMRSLRALRAALEAYSTSIILL